MGLLLIGIFFTGLAVILLVESMKTNMLLYGTSWKKEIKMFFICLAIFSVPFIGLLLVILGEK